MPNRLAHETSPYLLQHAQNPVDWYPWGPEALARARDEDKPIFLSIGYAACHWCHVMEHESFEDEATAAFLNEHFVAIKVDREERPDLDSIYMDAVVAITGQGGWPMSVFLTPDGVPFFGGTYYPKEPRYGMPAFRQVLEAIATAWRDERAKILGGAEQLKDALRRLGARRPAAVERRRSGGETLRPELLDRAHGYLSRAFDRRNGGFGGAPKFPQPMVLEFLLRSAVGGRALRRTGGRRRARAAEEPLRIVTRTLDKMARGGIYDQLGGGFHRYSVDDLWLVPHFEKMLYDNAQLATPLPARLAGDRQGALPPRRDRDPRLRAARDDASARRLLLVAGRRQPERGRRARGGRVLHVDAGGDRGGAGGRTTPAGARAMPRRPAEDVRLFGEAYGVTQHGNFEGRTILHEAVDPDVLAERHGLTVEEVERRLESDAPAAVRGARAPRRAGARRQGAHGLERPHAGRLRRGRARARPRRLPSRGRGQRGLPPREPARRARAPAAHVEGRRAATVAPRQARPAKLNGYLEDYADLAARPPAALPDDLRRALVRRRARARRRRSSSTSSTRPAASSPPATTTRSCCAARAARRTTPSPRAARWRRSSLVQLAAYTGDDRYAAAAEAALQLMAENAATMPLGFAQWLVALDLYLAPPVEVAIVGEDPAEPGEQSLLAVVRSAFRPHVVVAAASRRRARLAVPLLMGRRPVDGRPAAYVCRRFACAASVIAPNELDAALTNPPGTPVHSAGTT